MLREVWRIDNAILRLYHVRGRAGLLAARDPSSPLAGGCAFVQADRPAPFVAVNREEYFGFRRWVIDRIGKDEEIGPKLGNRQHEAIESQFHADVRGMTGV